VAVPGTSLGDAIRLAIQTYPKGGEGYRALVLLTDGEDHHSKPEEAAQEAKEAGIRILSIGFGTPGGEPIPVKDDSGRINGYLRNAAGQTVVSKLDEAGLKRIAEATGGVYWPAATGTLEAERMAELIGRMQKRDVSAGKYGAYEDRYQFVLVPALALLLFAFWLPRRRKSWLLLAPLALLLASPAQADVAGHVNQGNREYRKQRYEQSLQKYQDAQIESPESPVVQYDLGNALQRLGQYESAEQAYRRALKSKDRSVRHRAWHNLGNNFFKQEKYAEALEPYRQALREKPGDPDTLHNMALALRFLKQPPPKNQKDQKDPKQQKQQSGGKDQQSGAGQTPPNQDPNQKQEGQAQAGKSDPKQKGPDDRGEQATEGRDKQETPQDQAGSGARAPKPGEMSQEDAENLLNAVREAEQEAQRRRLSGIQDRGKGRVNAPEDW